MFFTLFLLLLIVSLIVTVVFAIYALRHRKTPGARPFILILLGYALYTAWYACELLADSLTLKIAWDNLQFTATDIIIIGYLWFALEYTRRSAAIRWLLPWLWVLLALNALVIWTNPVHHLVRSASELLVMGETTFLVYTYGPWFWFYIAYTFLSILAAVGILVVAFMQATRFYQLQVGAVIIGMLTPLVSSLLTVSGLMPFPELAHLDINPIAYLFITPIWGWAIFRQRFLSLVPIARRNLVEAMRDGVLVIDTQGHIVDCNSGAHALLPVLPTPCIGASATQVLPILSALLIGEPSRIRTSLTSADDASDAAQTWLEMRSTPLHSTRKHLIGWLVTLHDQTEYVQMENALREQNARLEYEILERQHAEEAYRTLVQYSLQGLIILQAGRVMFANPAIETIHGYSVAELLAMSAEELMLLVHPDDRAEVQQCMQLYITGEAAARRHEHRIVHKQGQTRWVEVYVAQVDFRGNPAFQLTFLDITERQYAEEAYRTLVDNSLQGLVILQDGRTVFANRAAAQITGYPIDELLAMSPEEATAVIHPDDRGMVVQRGKDRQSSKPVQPRYTFRIIRKDGSTRWLEAFAVLVSFQERPAVQMSYIDITERKQAEEALRESEARLQAIFDNAAVGIGLTDSAGQSIIANARGAQQLGYTHEELARLSSMEMTHPDDRAATAELIQQLLRGDISGYRIEKRYFRKDGSIFWADLSVSPVYDDDGRIAYLLGIVVDITERKQAEEALRESEQFVQQITTTIPDILYIYDLVLQRNVYSNRQMLAILGYTSEEIQAMGSDVMTTLVHPDDLPRVLEHLNRFAAIHAVDESISTVEYRMRHRDGHWCWLFSREVVFMRNSDGQPQQLLGIAQDITERKHAEEALRESEQRLQAIFDNAAVGIGLTDNAGQSIIINARGAQQLGYTHEELARLSSMEMTHPDDQAETAERMQQLLRGEIQGYRIEKRYFRKDGSIFWADLSVSAVYDDDGQIAYLLGIVVDITERKQLEQQLHQANVLLQEQAIRDSLTRLYNRRYLDEALPREFQRAERHSQSIGIIMIDVDHFKRFNDTYGHDAGDALLRAVGVFLQHHTRSEDIVCRYGGEEFTVVLPGASHEDASQRAEELRAGIQALVVTHQGQKMKGITASFGIAIFPAHGTTAEALVSAADQALYQAKYNGRNQVAVADNVRDYHKVGIDSS